MPLLECQSGCSSGSSPHFEEIQCLSKILADLVILHLVNSLFAIIKEVIDHVPDYVAFCALILKASNQQRTLFGSYPPFCTFLSDCFAHFRESICSTSGNQCSCCCLRVCGGICMLGPPTLKILSSFYGFPCFIFSCKYCVGKRLGCIYSFVMWLFGCGNHLQT